MILNKGTNTLKMNIIKLKFLINYLLNIIDTLFIIKYVVALFPHRTYLECITNLKTFYL